MSQTQSIEFVDPRLLKPHPDNPREQIDPADPEIGELSSSIAQHGVIEPIIATGENFILAGHRRTFAAIQAGKQTVPVVRREIENGKFPEEIFLAENVHRQNLSALEEARAIDKLRKRLSKQLKKDIGPNELSRRINMSQATIRDRLYILEMPERVQKLFHQADIPLRSAHQLYRLREWPEEIEYFADRMATREVSYASLDALISRRMVTLNEQKDADAIAAREPRLARIKSHYPEGHHTPVLTRETVAENLAKATGKITMFNVRTVFDATCCACGMVGTNICMTCPLPKFVNGLIGRSDRD
jgi:ParB family transcriptional regulator, chromosome partitioning protein